MSCRTITPDKIKKILADHAEWLKDTSKGARATLSGADLSGADLSYADLRYANLSGADLRATNLRGADLRATNLLIFKFQRHTAYFTFDGSLRIGCHVLPITKWAETYMQIGTAEGYSEQQIKAYGGFIKMCLEMFKEQTK